MDRYIYHQGRFAPANQPVLDAQNRAFRYGDALFETIRVINGKPCFLEAHLRRLTDGMALLRLEPSDALQPETLRQNMQELLKLNGIAEGGALRLEVYRDAGGLYTPQSNASGVLIEARGELPNNYAWSDQGLKIDLFEDFQKPVNKLSTLKSANALPYVLAGLYAREKKLDDCIMLNDLGTIAESVSSNLFIVLNRVLYTPSETQGCVCGVMREQVIDLARKNRLEVQECPLNPQHLVRADEVFLTNAVSGIRWVQAFRSKRYYNDVGRLLQEALNKRVASLAMDLQEN